MKVTVTLANLREAMGVVGVSAKRGAQIAVLGQVRIEATDGGLVLTTTDLDSEATRGVPCDVTKGGAVLVEHGTLASLLAKMPEGPVALSVGERGLAIKAGPVSAKLPTMGIDNFPRPRERTESATWSVTGVQLATMARRLPWTTSDLDSRPALQGVCWRIQDGRMDAVATDGMALALHGWPANGTTADVLMQPGGLAAAAKLFGGMDRVAVTLGGGWLSFEAGGITYRTRLLSEGFPAYRNVFPKNNDRRVVIDRLALLSAVQLAEIVAHDLTRRVALDFARDNVGVSADSEAGEGATVVPASLEGEPGRILFNAPKLIGALRHMDGAEIEMLLGGPLSPAIIRPTSQPEGEEITVLVTPLRDLVPTNSEPSA